MFNGPSTSGIWETLQKFNASGDRLAFARTLAESMPALKRDRDELNLLLFIGKDFDETAYRAMLTMLSGWRFMEATPDKTERCESFIYAARHSLPPRVIAAKPYLVPLFLETTGHQLAETMAG